MYLTKWMCTDSVKADEWVSGTASPILQRCMENGIKSKEVKTPAALLVCRTTLLFDQHVLDCGLH